MHLELQFDANAVSRLILTQVQRQLAAAATPWCGMTPMLPTDLSRPARLVPCMIDRLSIASVNLEQRVLESIAVPYGSVPDRQVLFGWLEVNALSVVVDVDLRVVELADLPREFGGATVARPTLRLRLRFGLQGATSATGDVSLQPVILRYDESGVLRRSRASFVARELEITEYAMRESNSAVGPAVDALLRTLAPFLTPIVLPLSSFGTLAAGARSLRARHVGLALWDRGPGVPRLLALRAEFAWRDARSVDRITASLTEWSQFYSGRGRTQYVDPSARGPGTPAGGPDEHFAVRFSTDLIEFIVAEAIRTGIGAAGSSIVLEPGERVTARWVPPDQRNAERFRWLWNLYDAQITQLQDPQLTVRTNLLIPRGCPLGDWDVHQGELAKLRVIVRGERMGPIG